MDTQIPLIILGGRDRGRTELPEAGRDKHVLRGYKSVDLEIGGRPLIVLLVDRLRACGRFDPIYIAGPRAIYEPVVDGVRFVDTDGNFGENIRASVETVKTELPDRPLAVTTGDILPDPAELERALDDYGRHTRRPFWMVTVRAPRSADQLGESDWKPKYGIQPEGEQGIVPMLPGHLLVVHPESLRLRFLYKILETVYRTRNRPVATRRAVLVRTFLLGLLGKDVRRLLALNWPNFTWTMLKHGLAIASKLARGMITQGDLELHLSRMFVRDSFRKHHPDLLGRVPVLEVMSLAKDIDTEEEAREVALQAQPDQAVAAGE